MSLCRYLENKWLNSWIKKLNFDKLINPEKLEGKMATKIFTQRLNLKIYLLLISLITALFFWNSGFADVPQQLFFQARLTKKDKTSLSGAHNLTFRLYTTETGGSSLWSETQSATADASGIISCYLGSTTSFPSSLDFNSTYYISIEVDSDGEMSPRIKIVPAISSLNTDRFDGLNSLQFLRSDTADTMEGTLTFSGVGTDITTASGEHFAIIPGGTGNVGIGITAPQGLLHAGTAVSSGLIVQKSGNVGIGITSPLTALHINSTDGLVIPVGTTAQRPGSLTSGIIRYNTTSSQFEGYTGSSWGSLGGVIDVDQDTYVSAENSAGADNDELRFFTANSERMFIGSGGNVGIGYTAPQGLLQVGTAASSGLIVQSSGKVGIGTTSPAGGLTIGTGSNANATTANDLYVTRNLEVDGTIYGIVSSNTGTFTDLVVTNQSDLRGDVLDTTGNLTLNDAVDITGALTQSGGNVSFDTSTLFVNATTDNVGIGYTAPQGLLQVGTAASSGLIVQKSGKVGIGTTSPAGGLTIGTGSNANATTADDLYVTRNLEVDGTIYGIVSSNTGTFTDLVVTNQSDLRGDVLDTTGNLTLNDSVDITGTVTQTGGNVGIGTTNPGAVLDINGTAKMTGFQLGTSTVSGYVLTANSSGVGTWQVATGGGATPGGSVNQFQVNYPSGTLAGTPLMVYDSTNNRVTVGVGATGMTGVLNIRGAGTGATFALRIADSTPTDRLVVLDNGNVGIGYTAPEGLLQVGTAASSGLIVKSSGNVGVGTTTPAERLHVIGNLRVSGTITSGSTLTINGGSSPGTITDSGGTISFSSNNLTTTGNVGIGTTASGTYPLYVKGNTYILGDHTISGTKSAVVPTSQGMRRLYTLEAADSRFEDFGSSQLVNGEVEVNLDPLFLETVTISTEHPMVITLTLTSDSPGIYVAGKTFTSFIVKEVQGGKSNPTFDYRVTAMRKGYENKRLELASESESAKKGG
jgi:cytoskeletal protein CcmA (bactofilin family)